MYLLVDQMSAALSEINSIIFLFIFFDFVLQSTYVGILTAALCMRYGLVVWAALNTHICAQLEHKS